MKINILRTILFSIGTIGFIWYLLPFLTHKILNIGNLSGLLLSSLLILYSIIFFKFNSFIIKLWSYISGKIILSIIGIIIASGIVLTICAITSMVSAVNEKSYNNQTLIVLGCRVYGEKPSLMLIERLDSAYKYLSDNQDSVCVLSGGKGNGEKISEAECMYRFLVNKGIDKNRLFKEEKSISTRENISFSNEIIKNNNLNSKIAIATNEFHEYRALKIAKGLGLNSSAIPCKTAWWLFPTYTTREIFGIIYEWFL